MLSQPSTLIITLIINDYKVGTQINNFIVGTYKFETNRWLSTSFFYPKTSKTGIFSKCIFAAALVDGIDFLSASVMFKIVATHNFELKCAHCVNSITSQIFDFLSWFCRGAFADYNDTSKYSFIILKSENNPK